MSLCGNPVGKSHWWGSFRAANDALWSHLDECDKRTSCVGFGPGIHENDNRAFDQYPELIEARLSKDGVLSYDSIIEESLTRAFECILDQRVRVFTELYNNWGPDCEQAINGCTLSHKNSDFYPTKFNVPVLRSIGTGQIFDRNFTSPFEDYVKRVEDSKTCVELLDKWEKLFDDKPENANLQTHRTGEGLTKEYHSCSPDYQMDAGVPALHPDLHPTQYEHRVPEDIRLILPTRGILPMGSSKDGMMHPMLSMPQYCIIMEWNKIRLPLVLCH